MNAPRIDPAAPVGAGADFAAPPGGDMAAFRRRLCVLAHRAWGKGAYRTETLGSTVRVTRIEPIAAAAPPPPPADPGPGPRTYLTREQAAAWLSPYFPGGLTAERLRGFSARGTGPRYLRNGRTPLYTPEDLAAWIRARLRPVEPSRAA